MGVRVVWVLVILIQSFLAYHGGWVGTLAVLIAGLAGFVVGSLWTARRQPQDAATHADLPKPPEGL